MWVSGERVSEQFAVPHRGVIAMYKHILIATDGSGLAQKAEATGLTLAKSLNAQACAVTVTEPWDALSMAALAERGIPNPVADYDEAVASAGDQILGHISETAKKIGIACATLHVKDKYPAEGIIETAKARACDLIVMASHGRSGLSRLLLGSQATKVVALSPVPVLVCR
jgi:nucleotide-binding universal stress UspA family protein